MKAPRITTRDSIEKGPSPSFTLSSTPIPTQLKSHLFPLDPTSFTMPICIKRIRNESTDSYVNALHRNFPKKARRSEKWGISVAFQNQSRAVTRTSRSDPTEFPLSSRTRRENWARFPLSFQYSSSRWMKVEQIGTYFFFYKKIMRTRCLLPSMRVYCANILQYRLVSLASIQVFSMKVHESLSISIVHATSEGSEKVQTKILLLSLTQSETRTNRWGIFR